MKLCVPSHIGTFLRCMSGVGAVVCKPPAGIRAAKEACAIVPSADGMLACAIESWGDPLMLRTVTTVIMMTFTLCQAHTEEAIPGPNWSAVTSAPRGSIAKSPAVFVARALLRVWRGHMRGNLQRRGRQALGVWQAAELPCYQLGHCKCEAAAVCKPTPAPKKKKNNVGDK